MLYFEEFDDSDELEEIPTGSEPVEDDFDDFDGDEDEEFEVGMDDLNTTLSQLGDDDEEEDSDTEYVDCPVSMIVRIKKSDADNLGRIENHIEEFVDLDSWPEIDSIYDVKVASPELYQDIKGSEN